MWLGLIFVFCMAINLAFASEDDVIYDKFTGKPITEETLALFKSKGLMSTCALQVKPCNKSEGRRPDGSCNNVDNPTLGTYLVPQERLVEAYYPYLNSNQSSTEDLELVRKIRTVLLAEGESVSSNFTLTLPAFGIWTFGDVGSTHDVSFFLINKTDCCEPEHMNDEMCTPNIIPEDDPVHRFSGIRCMNLTKPLDHQYLGCTNDSIPSPIAKATAMMDLSQIYNMGNEGDAVTRSFFGGLLAMVVDALGISWPPSGNNTCIGNKGPEETKCFDHYPVASVTSLMLTLWLIRNHNRYATELATVNPTWDDDKLYIAARELNIATYMRIVYHEWLPSLTGKEYLIKKGIMTEDGARRDLYNATIAPGPSLEFIYIMRYFHTIQQPMANKYDSNGTIIDKVSMTDLLLRPGYSAINGNLQALTPINRQPTAAADYTIHPAMSETGLPLHLQRSADLAASDLHKGRTLGMAPYVKYIEYCTGSKVSSWEDLEEFIDIGRIKLLQRVYKGPEQVELMAGAWSEKMLEGKPLGTVTACLITDYLKKNMITDRFFYERPNRVDPFTDCQLEEINKFTLATLMCKNGDGVTQVQKEAFRIISDTNPLVDCDEIPDIDFTAFAEQA